MDRRKMLGTVGVGATGFLAAGATAVAQAPKAGDHDHKQISYKSALDPHHQACLDACSTCSAVCNEAASHCLEELKTGSDNQAAHAMSHQLAMDCATMCATSATLIARSSPLMAEQCNACAEACARCAEACEKHQQDAAIMKECARVCRECEKSCREMARAMGANRGGDRR